MNHNPIRVYLLSSSRPIRVCAFFISLLAFLFAYLPTTLASSVVRNGETIALKAEQVVEGDFYGIGSTVAVSGEVTRDAITIGGTVTVNGSIGEDLLGLGGTVDIDGTIADDVRVVAGVVEVSGEVLGDLVVIAGELKVLSTAKVQGDILFYGTRADIAGEVGKDILGTSEQLRVDAKVAGAINVQSGLLTLGDQAQVGGNVIYTSPNELVRGQNASVVGDVSHTKVVPQVAFGAKEAAVLYLVVLFAALACFLFFRTFSLGVATAVLNRPWRSALLGLGALFAVPVVAIVLLVSTLGSIVGFTLLFSYGAIISFTFAVMGFVATVAMLRWYAPTKTVDVWWLTLGSFLLLVSVFIPLVGPIVFISLFCVTVGAIIERTYISLRDA